MYEFNIQCPEFPALDRVIIASKIHTAMHRYFENIDMRRGHTLAIKITNTGAHQQQWMTSDDEVPETMIGLCRTTACNSYSRKRGFKGTYNLDECVECSDTVDQGEAVDMTGGGFDLIGIYCESCANEIKYVAEMDDRQYRADRGIWED